MRILLLGEYSNVHATLADGLRARGHNVTVASNGDFWKAYPRDINLQRRKGKLGGLLLYIKILFSLPRFRGYDIVQLINPLFFELKAERHIPFFHYLKKHNKRVVLCAFGMDYYWVSENITHRPLRYSDFNIGSEQRHDATATAAIADWVGTEKETLNRLCASEADAIVTGLYEYDVCYRSHFPDKTTFIPLPIKIVTTQAKPLGEKIKVFIGISKGRSAYKGTDIMLRAAQDIAAKYPEAMELKIAEGVPFAEYKTLLSEADIILDQLYSYTPAMNALEAMSQGVVCVGGGEEENYTILHEQELRPIINVEPTYESVASALDYIIHHREELQSLKEQSITYVCRHHAHLTVARKYEELYQAIL